MWIQDRFTRKEKVKEVEKKPSFPEILDEECRDDPELRKDLANSLLVDPRILGTYAQAIAKAEAYENQGNKMQASYYYFRAGGLALFECIAGGVTKAYGKVAEFNLIDVRTERIRAVPENAIRVAKNVYERTLKYKKVS